MNATHQARTEAKRLARLKRKLKTQGLNEVQRQRLIALGKS